MGNPAARLGDMHTCPMVTGMVPHVGGPVSGPGVPTVLIGGMPAAVAGDMCVCAGPPDVIAKGSSGVMIGGKPAARMGDQTAHGGVIVIGCPTVLIGEVGSATMTSSPCEDSKVADMSHIEKMASSIKQSDVPHAVLNELGGWGGIAAGLVTAGVVLGAIALAPEILVGSVIVAAVGEVATIAGVAMSGYQIGEGIGHLANFYNDTAEASTCQALTNASKDFEQGVAKLGIGGVNVVMGAGDIQKAEKVKIAKAFYAESGFSDAKTLSHMEGINFSKDVEVVTLKEGTVVTQWVEDGKVGNYFTSVENGEAKNLGINFDNRSQVSFKLKEDAFALKSTAADYKGYPGGGTQYFSPSCSGQFK